MKLETTSEIVGALLLFFSWTFLIGYIYAAQWSRRLGSEELPAARRKIARSSVVVFLIGMCAGAVLAAGDEDPSSGLLFLGVMLPPMCLAFIGGQRAYFCRRLRRRELPK